MHGEDDAFEPADVEPTAWGTAWEQQMDQAEAAEANGGEDDRPDTAPNDWMGASGAAGGAFGGAGMVSGKLLWGQARGSWHLCCSCLHDA